MKDLDVPSDTLSRDELELSLADLGDLGALLPEPQTYPLAITDQFAAAILRLRAAMLQNDGLEESTVVTAAIRIEPFQSMTGYFPRVHRIRSRLRYGHFSRSAITLFTLIYIYIYIQIRLPSQMTRDDDALRNTFV